MNLSNIFKVKESFKDRTIGFWIGFGAGCFFLIATIALIVLYYSDNVFFHPDNRDRVRMAWVFAFFLIGVALQVCPLFTDLKFAPVIPVIFYSLGVGMYLRLAMFPIADIITGVPFFGGNSGAVIAFVILLGIGAIAAVATCFMSQRKTEKY